MSSLVAKDEPPATAQRIAEVADALAGLAARGAYRYYLGAAQRRVVTAVHPRACLECQRDIAVGDAYEHASVAGSLPVLTWTTCVSCAAWARVFADVCGAIAGEVHWAPGCLWIAMGAFVSDSFPELLARLSSTTQVVVNGGSTP